MADVMSKILKSSEHRSEERALKLLLEGAAISSDLRGRIVERAVELVRRIRDDSDPGMMELFLGEYGLSSEEGVALMCLAEALLRVPDGETVDALIDDKIAPSQWGRHLGKSHSSLINASTWALFLTGQVLNDDESEGVAGILRSAIKRLGEPVIRQAVTRVMKELGRQFVLGETIEKAIDRARSKEAEGFTYSYDMLGEAARTDADARRYFLSYSDAISEISKASASADMRENPGISIKLSALHPRYETLQRERVMAELLPRARSLTILAKSAGIGLNIDAEEAGRLDLSLEIVEALLSDPALKGWDGFGVVVQAYGLRASSVLDWLYDLARHHNRKIMVRLVKGAYWDTEIKHAQVMGLEGFPVFTRKASTDVSYICCAQKLLGMTDRIFPQFATHNAHTVAAILEMAEDKSAFEFQRLHGMGEALHDTVLRRQGTRCRIYAPVGRHKELLAYLVRRLLENGANSSFVNQIVDENVPPELVAGDPFATVENFIDSPHNTAIALPENIFQPERKNSRGWDIENPSVLKNLEASLVSLADQQWQFVGGSGEANEIYNPANGALVGKINFCTADDVEKTCRSIRPWKDIDARKRYEILNCAADLYEKHSMELFSLLMREAGKTLLDCVGEVREAVDFLRYYAAQSQHHTDEPAGVFVCISPWNFPLAIFTGQIAAALSVGNGVLAKPAESTPLVASYAVDLLHQAGVPTSSLYLLPGTGSEVGAQITLNPAVDGVCFTGSTQTAQIINRSMAVSLSPNAPLIAETGGLNAMIVDSTALPEQAIGDIIASSFQSAGQRCSALRMLYLQEDIADAFLKMLSGAMDELTVGDPANFATDVGPVIDASAKSKIDRHIDQANIEGRLLKQIAASELGTFVGPALIRVSGIEELDEEIFGPVLHVATYKQSQFENVIAAINAKGFGLTFGLHSRIDERVQQVIDQMAAGNIYINRNQIGAVVGSQPFGGEGLSGTGPKAGGPRYLKRFLKQKSFSNSITSGKSVSASTIDHHFDRMALGNKNLAATRPENVRELPGPTGESNRYFTVPRARVLCLGPLQKEAENQARIARALGCLALAVAPSVEGGVDGFIDAETLRSVQRLDAVVSWREDNADLRRVLAERQGPIVPLLTGDDFSDWLTLERHVCIDTTAAGGNASLLGGASH